MPSSRAERRRHDAESGVAVLEVLVLGIGLLVPLLYGVVSVMTVQAASYAATSAAREAARVHVTAATAAEGRQQARAAARIVLADSGLAPADVAVRCVGGCLAPGGRTDVTVAVEVPLPLLPGGPSLRVEATGSMPVDRYRARP